MFTLISVMVWLSDLGFIIPWYVWTLLVVEVIALMINIIVSVCNRH